MARHRVRNVHESDYGEDDDYLSQSPGSYPGDSLSSSVERQYMFNRNQSGTTPKMANFFDRQASMASLPPDEVEFELDLEVGVGGSGGPPGQPPDQNTRRLSRRDSSFDSSRLSSDELILLNSLLDYILDIVGDTVPENVVKTTIVRCNFDKEKTLDELLSKPGAQTRPDPQESPPKKPKLTLNLQDTENLAPKTASATVVKAVTRNIAVGFDTSLSPVVTSTAFVETPVCENRKLEVVKTESEQKRSRSNSPLPKQMDNLSLEGTPIHSGRETPEVAATTVTAPTPLKLVVMRKEKIDVKSEFEKSRGETKEMVNLVVIGHVDSGKSTLMGHLLFKLGNVSQKIMHKHEKESKKVGKQSFMYAWVLDETDEERERGITMDVGQNKFETDKKLITLLDAPGHRDFIPNMISGAYQADVGVLVVNATTGEFEAGFESGGQTREHALLVRSLGVSQLVVAVNKLDTVDWSKERFDSIAGKMRLFLTKQAGFKESDLTFLPCSGLTGENLVSEPTASSLKSWYSGPTLVQAIDSLRPPERLIDKPFRLSISDIFKGQSSGFSVTGRVESGYVTKDDKVLISPLNEVCIVKNVLVDQVAGWAGFAGDHVTMGLVGPDITSLTAGMVLSDPANPVPVTNRFQARIVVFSIDIPITKGYPVVMHYGCVSEQAVVKKLVSLLNKTTGEVVKSRPRVLTGNCSAVVEVLVTKPIPMELYKNNRELGRFMLRTGGHTIAAGMVTELM